VDSDYWKTELPFMRKIFISILLILFTSFTYGQVEVHDHDHDHGHALDDHKNHIGIAIGPVYIISEKEFAPGLHVHYVYLYEINNIHLGTGLGLETIFDDHKHFSTSINFSYFPIHNLTLTVAPGAMFSETSTEFTTHFEASYEFVFNKFHIGPLVEYAYATVDKHIMVGLHIGYGF
jgi:hypothetical protein